MEAGELYGTVMLSLSILLLGVFLLDRLWRRQAGTRGKVHICMPAEGYGFQILGHTVHIQAAVKQSFGQIAVIVVKNEFVIVQQEKE